MRWRGCSRAARHCRAQQDDIERENDADDDHARGAAATCGATFVTPFDRSAITGLIGSMDDAIDEMNKTAKAISLYEVTEFEPQMRDIGGIIVEAARVTAEAMPLLRSLGDNASRLHELTARIVQLEGDADDIHEAGLKALFKAAWRRATRWRSSSAARSTAISRGSSTASRTSPTRSRVSSSITPDGGCMLSFRCCVALIGVALAVRLPERPARRRQLDRDGGLDARAAARSSRSLWAAFFNFIAFLVFGLHVANTVGTGIVDADDRRCAGDLRRADRRDRLERRRPGCWAFRPRSSHALIGGLVGAGTAKGGSARSCGRA